MKNLLASYAKSSADRKRSKDVQDSEVDRDFAKKTQRNDTGPSLSACTGDIETNSSEPKYEGPPHFLIIGAQKAGTMAAVKNLNKHPEIACISEEHYFDLGWHSKTVKHYRSLFAKLCANDKRIIGEKTPEYGYVDECHNRMNSVCSADTKFIFMIRNPIKRAFSAWSMNIGRNFETNLFDECVDINLKNLNEYRSYGTAEHHYVQRGFYLDQILRFLKTFPNRDNLLVVVAEHIRGRPEEEYNRIFDFLGARRVTLDYEDDHIGKYTAPMSSTIAEKLRKIYEPHNERLFEFLGYRIPEWDEVTDKTETESAPK